MSEWLNPNPNPNPNPPLLFNNKFKLLFHKILQIIFTTVLSAKSKYSLNSIKFSEVRWGQMFCSV